MTNYDELNDRFKAAFERIKRADPSFPEVVLQQFPLALNDLEVEQIAVGQGWQGWQEEPLRPAAPSISSIPPPPAPA